MGRLTLPLSGLAYGGPLKSKAALLARYKGPVGMTKEQVLGSIDGASKRVNKTTTASGRREQWVTLVRAAYVLMKAAS